MKPLLLLAIAAAALIAADATGSYVGSPVAPTLRRRREQWPSPPRPQTGRRQTHWNRRTPVDEQYPIQNGAVVDGAVTFELSSEGGTMGFSLRLDGDNLSGPVACERNGRDESAKFAVKCRE